MPIRHTTIATFPDEPGAEINKDQWNADHTNPEISDVTGLQTALDAKVTDADVRGGANSLSQRLNTISNFASPNVGGYVDGAYYDFSLHGSSNNSLATVTDTLTLGTFYTSVALTADRVGISCGAAGAAGSLAKIVFYTSDADGWPDELIYETGEVDLTTTGFKFQDGSFEFASGVQYWCGVWAKGDGTLRTVNLASCGNLGMNTSNSTSLKNKIQRSLTYGTGAPDPWVFDSAELVTGGPFSVRFRYAE